MAKLAVFVHVLGDDGQMHVFGPGDDVPDWAAKKITNPDAWAAEPGPDGGRSQSRPAPKRAARRTGKEG